MRTKFYYVYIVSNKTNNVLYVGITSDIVKRIYEHKTKAVQGFTCKYNISKLLYYEIHTDVNIAIEREKQIKKWSREKKFAIIETINKEYKDLYNEIILWDVSARKSDFCSVDMTLSNYNYSNTQKEKTCHKTDEL